MINEQLDVRDTILRLLKQERTMSIATIAQQLPVSYEAVRQHLAQMENQGWVERSVVRSEGRSVGRPTAEYSLTVAGDHLFPKSYDLLASTLVGAIDSALGEAGLQSVLAAITEAQVSRWAPLLQGRSLEERLRMLRSLYAAHDQFMEAEISDTELRLVEHNCPYHNVAMRNPALCSTSVSALTRLLGYQVVREERFQNGDRRCVFRVMTDRPVDPDSYGFRPEPALPSGSSGVSDTDG